jgi:hypothetical protein
VRRSLPPLRAEAETSALQRKAEARIGEFEIYRTKTGKEVKHSRLAATWAKLKTNQYR